MKLSNKQYDVLKFLALVLLPAASTFYVTLGNLWGFPEVEKVVGTIVAIDTLLGLMLKNASTNYEGDGDLVVTTDPSEGDKYLGLNANKPVTELEKKDLVQFKVVENRPQTLEDYNKE
jgi:hypothetical protein